MKAPTLMRSFILLLTAIGLANPASAAAEADLLVAFDNSYIDGVGGDENAEVLTANSVAASNWINEQSGSPARMRICGYHKTWWQGGRSTLGGYIGWMANYGDGELNDVTAAADAAGADLVAFICAPAAGETAAAVAEQPGRYAAYGTGNFWNNVVAHESGGHNFGLDHRAGRENPKTIMMHNYCAGGGSQPWYSNPNLRLNGVRLLGEGSCLGGAVQGGDSAYHLSTSAQGVADRRERLTWGSNLYPVLHRWQFNRPAGAAPAGTTVASDTGGALATVRGQGATYTGSGLRIPGGTTGNTAANSIAAYIDLPNGLFSSLPNFTIEIWATPQSAKNWMRVIEIGRTTQAGDGLGAAGEYTGGPGSPAPGATDASDVIGLSAVTWTGSLDDQRLIAGVNGANQIADSNLATTAGQIQHYAITFTDTPAGGTVKWFRNGALVRKLDVGFDSAALEDVNIWLGRSLWSGDEMGHFDYHDVRVIGATLADGQVAGNYRIGPHDAKSTLWANDAWGSSGFLTGAWEFGGTPVPSRDYEVGTMRLLAPWTTTDSTFPGKSLSVTGGNFMLAAKDANTVTVSDLRLNGGATVHSLGDGGSTQTLAGNISVANFTDNHIRGNQGPLVISANISGAVGGGGLLYTENPVTLTGNNSGYRGATLIGDGRFSTLRIASETHLGGNPTFYGGAWLQLNRGILETTATMTIDDPNRGVLIGPSGGIFRPAAGTTLTLATTLNSPAAGNTLQTVPMFPNPVVGLFFKEGAGTLVLTNPNNSYIGEMRISDGELRLDGAGRLNNGDMHLPLALDATLNVNTTGNQIFGGVISGGGTFLKGNSGTTTFYAANTFTGSVTANGGTLYARAENAANNRNFSFVSGITVNNGATLRTQANSLFGWDGSQDRPVTVNAGGTLTADAGADVGVGTVTLNGGTLANLGASAAWGSWRFDQATDKLLVTADSTVTATHVKFGSAAAAIEVSSGRTLNVTGTLTDATNGGPGHLRKTGTGTLFFAGANTHTGPTALEAGTTFVNGSLANTPVTVAAAATLGGAGSIAGATGILGTHRPGNSTSPGTQAFGGTLGYGAASRLKWELASNSTAPGAHDRVTASGAVTITAGAAIDFVLNAPGSSVALDQAFWTQPRSWTFLTGSNITGGFILGTVTADPAGRPVSNYGTLSLQQNATSASLVFTPHTPSEIWRFAHFGTIANSGNAADGSDPDKDGLNNLLEYALGSIPTTPNTAGAPQVSTASGKLHIAFTRNTAATDLILSVMASDALASPWAEIARSTNGNAFAATAPAATVNESGTGPTRAVETTDIHLITDPAHPKRFMRLEVAR
jgi:autotransporter-associated beta strand protein